MKNPSKHYKDLHSTRVSLFFRLKREAVERKDQLMELNEGSSATVGKVIGGENKGKWMLRIVNQKGVEL